MTIDLDTYLRRVEYVDSRAPTLDTLRALHCHHMRSVPFENLDVPLGRPITLSADALWHKIVVLRRGGFCYELNTLFGHLLQALGFRVDFLSARVWTGAGFGPDKDHMALRVDAEGSTWLADVGFGDSFIQPLRLAPDLIQRDAFTSFRLLNDADEWTMQVLDVSGTWKPEYRFTLQAHLPESFAAMCQYQQTSPDSTFTRRVVCSRATGQGRVTTTHNRLIVTSGGERDERPLPDAEALRTALSEQFGIVLAPEECATIVGRFANIE